MFLIFSLGLQFQLKFFPRPFTKLKRTLRSRLHVSCLLLSCGFFVFSRMGGRYIPRGRGGYIPRMRRGRARYFNNYRPRERDYRRYDRDMSRSDDDMDSPMRKVDLAKERIDKLLSEDKRHTGPLSEGEERDDDYIERKDYEGKWSKDVTPSDIKSDKKEDSKDRKSYSKPNPW